MALNTTSPVLGHGWKPQPKSARLDDALNEFFERILPIHDPASWPRDLSPPTFGSGSAVEARYNWGRALYFYVGLVHREHAQGRMGLLLEFPIDFAVAPFDTGAWVSGPVVKRVATILNASEITLLEKTVDAILRRSGLPSRTAECSIKLIRRAIPGEFSTVELYLAGRPPRSEVLPPVLQKCLPHHPKIADRRAWTWEVRAPGASTRLVRYILVEESLYGALQPIAVARKLSVPALLSNAFPNGEVQWYSPRDWSRGPIDLEEYSEELLKQILRGVPWT